MNLPAQRMKELLQRFMRNRYSKPFGSQKRKQFGYQDDAAFGALCGCPAVLDRHCPFVRVQRMKNISEQGNAGGRLRKADLSVGGKMALLSRLKEGSKRSRAKDMFAA